MHEKIMRWPSIELYGGKLEAHDSVKGHLLVHLQNVENHTETSAPLLLIDTAGCGLEESQDEEGVIIMQISKFISIGIQSKQWRGQHSNQTC
jgi:superfamily I DNA and/or RNA helicase